MAVADHAVRAARVDYRGIYQTTHTPVQAESCLSDWCAVALGSGLQTICRFARVLLRGVKGFTAYSNHRITSSLIDAFNNQLAQIDPPLVWHDQSRPPVSQNEIAITPAKLSESSNKFHTRPCKISPLKMFEAFV